MLLKVDCMSSSFNKVITLTSQGRACRVYFAFYEKIIRTCYNKRLVILKKLKVKVILGLNTNNS